MKKAFFVIFSLFYSIFAYSQTWIEGSRDNRSHHITLEYTIVTMDDFNRLVQQYKARNGTCNITFTDKLELNRLNYPVLSGTRPVFTDYYFLFARK